MFSCCLRWRSRSLANSSGERCDACSVFWILAMAVFHAGAWWAARLTRVIVLIHCLAAACQRGWLKDLLSVLFQCTVSPSPRGLLPAPQWRTGWSLQRVRCDVFRRVGSGGQNCASVARRNGRVATYRSGYHAWLSTCASAYAGISIRGRGACYHHLLASSLPEVFCDRWRCCCRLYRRLLCESLLGCSQTQESWRVTRRGLHHRQRGFPCFSRKLERRLAGANGQGSLEPRR